MAMNSFLSGAALRSSLRSVVGGSFRLGARLVDGGISRTPTASMERPEDVFGRPQMAPHLPGETQDEYMARVHRANEAAIMTLGRAMISLDHQITRSCLVLALRFRQLLFLEAAAASLVVGLFVLFPNMPSLMRLIILVLTPITLAGGGLWFANHASAIGEALDRHAQRWNR